MTDRILTNGKTEKEMLDFNEVKPNGQQKAYVILSDVERSKGFVRPLRYEYVHQTCGYSTGMNAAIAETYARDPFFYGSTFCTSCRGHFPVGADGEFVWKDTNEKVGT